MTELVVLAGPADRIAEGAAVVVVVDLGQGGEDPETTRRHALASGAAEVVVIDARDEFVEHYGLPALRAATPHPDLVPALSQPLIAQHVVRVAQRLGATAVAGADPRFALAVHALAPHLEVRAPTTRPAPPVPRPAHPYDNELVVTFDQGVPVALDGETVTARQAVRELNLRAGGRHRERLDAPGALALAAAHRELEDLTLEPELARFTRQVGRQWGELVRDGQWFSPLKQALDSVLDTARRHVSGEIRIVLPGGRDAVRPAAEPGGNPLHQTVAKGFVQL